VAPTERELSVPNAKQDKSRRGKIALVLGLAVAFALILVRQPMLGGMPGPMWSTAVMIGAIVLAWQSGLFPRAHALLRLGRIRRDGLAATAKLNEGDIAGAREGFAQLLVTARPLGAFHAVHLLMYGVTRFFEGATQEGLTLAARAIDSGWLDLRHTRAVRDSAETWRILMLLEAGELAEARRRVDTAPRGALTTAAIAVSAYDGKWDAVLEDSKRALEDPRFPRAGWPTIAVLGLHAAKKLGRDGSAFKKCLDEQPLGPLALKNPALKKFL
jgi:hypothetical protein